MLKGTVSPRALAEGETIEFDDPDNSGRHVQWQLQRSGPAAFFISTASFHPGPAASQNDRQRSVLLGRTENAHPSDVKVPAKTVIEASIDRISGGIATSPFPPHHVPRPSLSGVDRPTPPCADAHLHQAATVGPVLLCQQQPHLGSIRRHDNAVGTASQRR